MDVGEKRGESGHGRTVRNRDAADFLGNMVGQGTEEDDVEMHDDVGPLDGGPPARASYVPGAFQETSPTSPMTTPSAARHVFLFLLLVAMPYAPLTAQSPAKAKPRAPKSLTLDDVLLKAGQFAPRLPQQMQWHADGQRLVWVEKIGDVDGVWARAFDAPEGTKPELLASTTDIASALSLEKPPAMPRVEIARDGKSLRFDAPSAAAGKPATVVRWDYDLATKKAEPVHAVPAEASVVVADGKGAVAFVNGGNLHVSAAGAPAIAVTSDASVDIRYGVSVHREEFGIKDGLWMDPTGRRVAFYREDLSPILPHPFIDWEATPAAATPARYPITGTANSKVKVGVAPLSATGATSVVWLDFGDADRWYTNVTWSPDGESLYVAVVDRGQDAMELVRFNATSGAREAVLFKETDKEWVEPEHGPVFLPNDPGKFLWQSEREGFEQLYLVDVDGRTRAKVTPLPVDVSSVLGFTGDHVIVAASDDDPKTMHLWKAALDGSGMTPITKGRGRHAGVLAPGGRHLLDTWSSKDTPPRVDVVALADGARAKVAAARDPFAGWAMGTQEWFTVESPHGGTMHGHRILPPAFDATKKYPVLWYVYGGPHSQLVTDTWMAGANLWLHFMATQGYVVCRVDGHGTPNRGIAWEQAIHRRLGTVEIDDQIAALDAVKALPYVDANRVGLHGWSYGGFMTASLMCRAPKAFTCGISGAPVTGWDLYETGYGERYMDTPAENPEGYKTSDVRTWAKDLKGDLLIIHGTADNTVVWQNTVRLLDTFIKAGRDVETMVYPGQLHGLQGPSRTHFYRKMTKWFATRLNP